MHTPYVYVREAVLQLQFGVLNTYYLDLLIDTEVSYRNQIARQAKLYAHIVASPKFSPPPPEQRHRSGRDGPCKVILVLLLCKIGFFFMSHFVGVGTEPKKFGALRPSLW